MATNNLLQRLPTPGETFTNVAESHRRTVETFIASNPIAVGQFVAFDTSKTEPAEMMIYVNPADSDSNNTYICAGVALHAAAAGGRVEVVTSGIAEARVASGLGANSLQVGGTAGEAIAYDPAGAGKMIARSIDTGAGATPVTVFVYKTL